ncbi:DUF4041 domain-containing protein [Oceanisphaera arctica]|uniref:ATPase n=1 Tax=Oceanisphaera arctica TaxID=641510 RepID=A0A2P5TQL3_9GAMM|nr:DUF4041 domain-containing protein [Oceanisphaera arctica]PPL18001.1 ATPase [Oceanisphaera arctica]
MEETKAAGDGVAVIITLLIFLTPLFVAWLSRRKRKKLERKLIDAQEALAQAAQHSSALDAKYKPITDMELHAQRLLDEAEEQAQSIKLDAEQMYSKADNKLVTAMAEAERLVQDALTQASEEAEVIKSETIRLNAEAREKIKSAKSKAEQIEEEGRTEANKVIDFAKRRAEEIAGDALEAKGKADLYEATVLAMRNTIDGYKDDYIIPNHAVLDELAEEYSHKEAGEQLKQARKRVRDLVQNGHAGNCDYVEHNRKVYAIHFAVDAFNGKVDSALAKVKNDNYGKIKQEILDAFALVNHNGMPFRNARINREYLDARLEELKWAVATHELRQIEREEQREIREQMREEEKARREMEKAIKEAEKEERMLQKALEAARKELASANDEQRLQYEAQLTELEAKLVDAEARGQRAISMAQQTRRGHVYVISNIGSFGENVFKIGMTRRLEPLDRVKELGDASVPFDFDVHAMIYSDDAPALEKELHRRFDEASVNKVNPRKEFFSLNLAEIRQAVEQQGMNEAHWTMKAEATEYRESLSISKKQKEEVAA